jgi:hypothetical protein
MFQVFQSPDSELHLEPLKHMERLVREQSEPT